MKSYFQKHYEYEFWANQEVLEKIEKVKQASLPERVKAIFSHLIIAQKIWLTRLQNTNIDTGVWDNINPENWRIELEKNHQDL